MKRNKPVVPTLIGLFVGSLMGDLLLAKYVIDLSGLDLIAVSTCYFIGSMILLSRATIKINGEKN